jgi:LCP family protein required for cell wall assembly
VSDTSMQHDAGDPGHPDSDEPPRRGRGRRIRRIALVSAAVVVVVIGAIAGSGYLFANHVLSSVHRIDVPALDAPHQPVMPAATRAGMTILLTSFAAGPTPKLASSTKGPLPSAGGFVTLVHLDANQRTGAVISIPPNAIVRVPGHGRTEIGNALALGGPSLLVKTVERLTDVRIDHYSVLSLTGALQVIDSLDGINVDVPYATTSLGHVFHQGINHVNGGVAIAYARQPAVSEIGRELLQQNLIRSILDKIAHKHLFDSPVADYRLVRALAGAMSVDSNLSNSGLESLALHLGKLGAGDGVFVTAPAVGGSATLGGDAPVHLKRAVSRKLWQAIRSDSVAAFAQRYPTTVTTTAPA